MRIPCFGSFPPLSGLLVLFIFHVRTQKQTSNLCWRSPIFCWEGRAPAPPPPKNHAPFYFLGFVDFLAVLFFQENVLGFSHLSSCYPRICGSEKGGKDRPAVIFAFSLFFLVGLCSVVFCILKTVLESICFALTTYCLCSVVGHRKKNRNPRSYVLTCSGLHRWLGFELLM